MQLKRISEHVFASLSRTLLISRTKTQWGVVSRQNLFPKSELQYDHHSHFTDLSKNKHSKMTSVADFFAVISELTNEQNRVPQN